MTTEQAARMLNMKPMEFLCKVRDGELPIPPRPEGIMTWDTQAVLRVAVQRKAAENGWGHRCVRAGMGCTGK